MEQKLVTVFLKPDCPQADLSLVRLEVNTLFRVRNWERYQFLIDYEHAQAKPLQIMFLPLEWEAGDRVSAGN